MKNNMELPVRVFPISIRDERTGSLATDTVVLTKDQLRAAEIVGQSSKELIYRLYNREGYRVLDIGKPIKRTLTLDLYHAQGRTVAEGEIIG